MHQAKTRKKIACRFSASLFYSGETISRSLKLFKFSNLHNFKLRSTHLNILLYKNFIFSMGNLNVFEPIA